MPFRDREDAGRRLAARLGHLRGSDVVVLGLPRGGVPVAAQVARALGAPLDVVVVRKIGVPAQPELAMGAAGEDGTLVLNDDVLRSVRPSRAELDDAAQRARAEAQRRAGRLRGGRPRVPLRGRTALVVDDGIATGATARAACLMVRAQGAARVVLAAPVCAPEAARLLGREVDELVCPEVPQGFAAVGQFYDCFEAATDEEVQRLLTGDDAEVEIDAGGVHLGGHLAVPPSARGLVVFAHGSGSGRHSPRNRAVAAVLHEAGCATLLFDLLTAREGRDRRSVFDIGLLARRLTRGAVWARRRPECRDLPLGYFGASTGAAAALWAAADEDVAAVVSRGGRPDLAEPRLAEVRAPTLLIVGGADPLVQELNEQARARLQGPSELVVVPGAGHLFAEPGALEQVAELARDWFVRHLTAAQG